MVKYVFDREKGEFVPKRASFWQILLSVVRYIFAAAFCAVLFYCVFALAYSTEEEKMLERENRALASEYASLSAQLDLLDGAVGHLRSRDREIYRDLFNADPPNYLVEARDTLLSGAVDPEDMAESDLVWDAYALTNRIESTASMVSRTLAEMDTLLSGGTVVPTAIPSRVPLAGFSPVQTGASTGKKVHPFYKNIREHTGIDLVAPTGTPVLCSADGKVSQVVRSEKGMGNQVTVDHKGGFRTTYSHLDGIRVSVGQNLRQGDRIGTVGQTGSCFAPCLHYEVLRDGEYQDPVNYFFAELDPVTYRDMMIVALTTGQSMD